MTYAEAVLKAAEALGKGVAIKEAVDPAVADILGIIGRLKREQNIDVTAILNGDPIHDRTILAGAALEGELTAATDWSAVADQVFRVAWSVLTAAAKLAVIL